MSTLPGVASKGEKSKQKFQSLDINNLYRVSRGENLEKQQQKNTFTYKHGMQSLGKVPNARRAPANLPSLKSEHSGTDASVPLVPPGGPGWGKQDSTTGTSSTSPTTTTTTASSPNNQPSTQLSSHQAAIALPVTTTIPPNTNKHPTSTTPSATPATTDKSWSSVMTGPEPIHPPLYQSQQFQHEFPSLSVGDGGPIRTGSDSQYTPGLSLRPQTEGSWIQGGSRPGHADGPPRSSSVPLGAPPQLVAPVGLTQQPLPPQYRAVMPNFMYKGNFPPTGASGIPNQNPSMNGSSSRRPENRPQQPRMVDAEEITPRPIIKEEELSRMDQIEKDMSWTCHDEIDYNQKLAFSDDESENMNRPMAAQKRDNMLKQSATMSSSNLQNKNHDMDNRMDGNNHLLNEQSGQPSQRGWNTSPGSLNAPTNRQRTSDEEVWKQRRNQHNKNLELTVQRAKQRKEEEEKRFIEATRQGANKKLLELEEKMSKRNREEENAGTINPSVVPPKPIIPADIPLPDFQREKERDRESRSRTPNDVSIDDNNKMSNQTGGGHGSGASRENSSFRQLTQIEGKNFASRNNKHMKSSERDRDREIREQNGPNFSRHFQNQLPPRFQKQRNNNNNNNSSNQLYHSSSMDGSSGRWMNKRGDGSPDRERELIDDREYKRQSSEDSSSHRGGSHKSDRFGDDSHEYGNNSGSGRHSDYEYGRRSGGNDKWKQERNDKKHDDDWHMESRDKYRDDGKERHDRPQRPDSRDSKASRESRHSRDSTRDSESREHIGSWADCEFETTYEEKRTGVGVGGVVKDHHHGREERRQVPGPITKDRIEADDLRSEKRNLTQLKRGQIQIPEKKMIDKKDGKIQEETSNDLVECNKKDMDSDLMNSKVWSSSMTSSSSDEKNKVNDNVKHENDLLKSDKLECKDKDDNKRGNIGSGSRLRNYPTNKSWSSGGAGGGSSEYHRSAWLSKRQPSGRMDRGGRGHRSGDFHTDSEGSMDDMMMNNVMDGQKSPKPIKKFDKDDKNKEIKHDKNAISNSGSGKMDKQQDNNAKRESYVPRGEPSRHGRGGGNNFRGGRGGMSKRIDGYGPPPSKSPFGHHDDKEKKLLSDENSTDLLLTQGSSDDRAKQNQQALQAGISVRKDNSSSSLKGDDKGKLSSSARLGSNGGNNKSDRRPTSTKPKSKNDDIIDSNSDNSDDKDGKIIRKPQSKLSSGSSNLANNNVIGSQRSGGISSGSSINSSGANRRTNNPLPRMVGMEKKQYNRNDGPIPRQNSSGALRSSQSLTKKDDKLSADGLNNLLGDLSLKPKLSKNEIDGLIDDGDEQISLHGDSDGFQEVKSKKTGKERQKSQDDVVSGGSSSGGGSCSGIKTTIKSTPKLVDSKLDGKPERKKSTSSTSAQLTQQQISNIPPLMATPINPPSVMSQLNKFERSRLNKLAPRFAKQREHNRLQKVQMQHQTICDVNDMNKVNQSMNVYNMKDSTNSVAASLSNAWDNKSALGPQLRNIDDNVLAAVGGGGSEACKVIDHQSVNQSHSPNTDKIIGKSSQLQDKSMLDGSTPPMTTIIFENTNFKSAPGARSGSNTATSNTSGSGNSSRNGGGGAAGGSGGNSASGNAAASGGVIVDATKQQPRQKLEEGMVVDGGGGNNAVVTGFNKPIITDLLCKNEKQSDSIQIALNFKEDNADIKLDFFGSELSSHLTDDKSSKNLCMPRSMHVITTDNSTISTADALNFKIQSVKKMWETPSDHSVGPEDTTTPTFSTSFVTDPNTLDPNAFGKGNDSTADDNHHEGYSPSPNQVASNNTTNVCKVKPTQQVSGSGAGGSQTVLNSANHQQHSGIMGQSLMGNPLSPPPLPAVIGTGVNLGQPPQQYTTNQHLSYQAGLGGNNQYGISAIPSPPSVMYNSTQQLPQTAGLYGTFQLDQASVLGGQQRSQYSQYYGLGQTASSPYSNQSVYLSTQPHPPPPTAQAPPDLYPNISNYRMSATGPFGQNQQLTNPTTVLISSTSNSLMSPSVKPSGQQISAIGTKTGGVGQAYQQQSQQSQVYMAYEPSLQANYLPNAAGVMQRGPNGPVQNNVVAPLQPSSSYYSGSTGQTGYFQQPGSSTIQSAQLQQHQAGYGLHGNVFGNQSHTNAAGLQSFNSHFLSTNIQIAAALNTQQFRNQQYTLKGVSGGGGGGQQMNDQSGGRSQQLKSPSSQEMLCSVFNSSSQISSPKLRQNCKQPQPQPSPTAQQKYNLYQGVGGNQQSSNRYPAPIQRPIHFQQNLGGSVHQNNSSNSSNPKHRTNNSNNKVSSARQYYQSNSISSQNDKVVVVDDGKLSDGTNSTNVNSTVANKAVVLGGGGGNSGNNNSTTTAASDITKDAINLEESSSLKD